ncbi:6-phosphogluconolactonase [Enterobacter asburiae]|uniref:6-phosphogluconolactonase n=1 Tax=Enterobacter asburiae TaxID=61645 RepID=A0A376FJ19_ENTAS|nr:6-phosphogluconolactonase [Enterobacter asburiae]
MHTRTLLVASLSMFATAAIAQPQYAWVGTYNPQRRRAVPLYR